MCSHVCAESYLRPIISVLSHDQWKRLAPTRATSHCVESRLRPLTSVSGNVQHQSVLPLSVWNHVCVESPPCLVSRPVETCSTNPCFPGVQCVEERGRTRCGPCPPGYIGDGRRCQRKSVCGPDTCFKGKGHMPV